MLKIKERARALQVTTIDGALFPDEVFLQPLAAPIFNLIIRSRLKAGPTFVLYNSGPIADVILAHSDISLNLQRCHSFSEQSVLFPKGTIISFFNDFANVGYIIVTAYTFYWEV